VTAESQRAFRSGALGAALAGIGPVDDRARDAAIARQEQLTKPSGALGQLETLGVQLAALTGECPPPVPRRPAVAVFAGDHGVVRSGVTPWPQDVTAQMVANFVRGGAAINVLANEVGAAVHVVDIGVAADLSSLDGVLHHNVRHGTDDLSTGPAMTADDACASLEVGAVVAAELVGRGHDLLVTGEMGIGNTTPAAALVAAFTGYDAYAVTGRGTGIDDAMLAHKTEIVAKAVGRLSDRHDPVSVLAEIGGLEIGGLAGYIIGGAAARVVVVIDGLIACAGALLANEIVRAFSGQRVVDWCIAGHRSVEPGASVALEHLGLEPLLDLGLRLGEGTGACLAIPVVQSAAAILGEMATFADLVPPTPDATT
jgi:nicotinate-nucleotide--dimethylbenzimidazole phosphoribosyltransferase